MRCATLLLLAACTGSSPEETGTAEPVDFVPIDGFYLVNYDGWDHSTCVVYPQDRLGAEVNVKWDGAQVDMTFDKHFQDCSGDVETQTFTCETAVRSVSFGDQGLNAQAVIYLTMSGAWSSAETFEGSESIRIECSGDAEDCLRAKDMVPPFPWASEDMTFPCETSSTYRAEWIEP